jgi:uncharacterized membrane protein YhfC
MRRPASAVLAVCVLLLAVLAAACSRPAAPFKLTPAWSDTEEARYDLRAGDGSVMGTEAWSVERSAKGWIFRYEETRGGHTDKGQIEIGKDMRLISSSRESGGKRVETEYQAGSAKVRETPAGGGAPKETTIAVAEEVLDNEGALMLQRGLVLPEGGSTSYLDVMPRTGAAARVTVTDEGRERVDVPAGSFEVRCLGMLAGVSRQRACYSVEAPRLLVLYENPKAHASFALRAYRMGPDAPWEGAAEAPKVRTEPVPIRWLTVIVALLVDVPIMLFLPVYLGYRIKKRYGVSWMFWAAGAGAFIASQVVHLPLNWALGLLGKPKLLGLLPLPWLALAAGLSAGLCEELARFVTVRFVLRKARRTWQEALQLGAGHGGVEAMILGLLALTQIGAMVFLSLFSPAKLGVPPEQMGAVDAARDAFWLMPPWTVAIGGLERLSAMSIHVACSVLVVRGVARRQPLWLLAAIGLHTLVDGLSVWLVATAGIGATEVSVGVIAILALVMVWALREPTPVSADPASPAPGQSRAP